MALNGKFRNALMVSQRVMPQLQSLKFKEKLLGKTQSSDALIKKIKVHAFPLGFDPHA
jgi:hypothetical protein